jgi:hypothetical protein
MRNRLFERISLVLLAPLQKTAVAMLGLYTLFWGLWVAAPWWDVFSRAELYKELLAVAPEWAWGLLAIGCGLAILWGAIRESYRSLVFGANVSWLHWFVIAIMYFWGDWQNTGGITSAAIAFYSAVIALNIKINYKIRHISMHDMFS